MAIHELRAKRATAFDKFKALAGKKDFTKADQPEYDRLEGEINDLDAAIARIKSLREIEAKTALAVADPVTHTAVAVKSDPYEKDPSLIVGAFARLAGLSRNDADSAYSKSITIYGERHPVTEAMGHSKALSTGIGAAGAFAVPPDFYDYIVPLLYAKTTVRKAGATTMPMPNGTMTISKVTAGMSASWGADGAAIGSSQQTFGQIEATAHKLTALLPVTNDLMRYATPGFDGRIRDDLVMQIALAEDIAFLRSLGTAYQPKGLRAFVLAGETITSNFSYTLSTVTNELSGMLNKLESANIPLEKPAWVMHPRTKNYLMAVQNSLGVFVYREMMLAGQLLGYPYFTTTQLPTNLTVNSNPGCSELYFCDFAQTVILEGRKLEVAVSLDGTYLDQNSVQQSAFQNDMTLIRGIVSEDFQMWHSEGVAFLNGVAWSPALS